MNEKLLPLGSVVRLTDGTKKLMIEGYHIKANDSDKIYTYCGVIWPEGHMENKFCLFDPYQIEEICFKGLENDETNQYAEKISSILNGTSNVNSLNGTPTRNANENQRGRVKVSPNKVKSKSEMKQIYGVEKISGGNIINTRGN